MVTGARESKKRTGEVSMTDAQLEDINSRLDAVAQINTKLDRILGILGDRNAGSRL